MQLPGIGFHIGFHIGLQIRHHIVQWQVWGACRNQDSLFLVICFVPVRFFFENKVFNYFNVFFELPHAKPCRIIRKSSQKVMSKPKKVTFSRKSRHSDMSGPAKASPGGMSGPAWTCLDLSGPIQEDNYLLQTNGYTFCFSKNYTFPFLLTYLSSFNKIM